MEVYLNQAGLLPKYKKPRNEPKHKLTTPTNPCYNNVYF